MPKPPWDQPAGVDAVVSAWLEQDSVARCLAIEKLIEAEPARYAPIPAQLTPALRRALSQRGITRLYTHQAEAVEAAIAGRHVVIATPTASGKSLCFHLPVLHAIAEQPTASALFVYPTKALSRDQEHNLRQLISAAELPIPATVYDGDTPGDARRSVRERCRIVLTNPDMLHASILPNHTGWLSLLSNLRYVVLDELHTYRGVFGSHMAHVLARLRRLARFHGSDPVFIAATATIGNPRAHAARLIGAPEEEVLLVDQSGAPQASRRVFMYNPPVVNSELGIRASTLKRTVALTTDLVRAKVPTLVFGPSRNSVEVMLKYLRAECGEAVGNQAIMAYRGGYLPEERRRIERGLREGQIVCVVATNALELGIDIGDLDAVVCAGYPGSIAGLWQRFGRAGRRGGASIALLVCNSGAVDQYLAHRPEYLLGKSSEEARIDPGNLEITLAHLKCAIFEAPFELTGIGPRPAAPAPAKGETYLALDEDTLREALEYLARQGLVHRTEDRYFWAGQAFPANDVSLRNIGWDNFVIVDVETDKSIAELDWRAAHTMLHEQAIYQHDAEEYQVERLDFENHKAFVRRVKPDYFTTALTYRSVTVLDITSTGALGRASLGFGEVNVVEKVTGYKKIKFFTHENAGYGDVHLPEMEMHTTSFWLTFPEALLSEVSGGDDAPDRARTLDAIRAIGAALKTVSTLAVMCDPRDLNRTLGDGSHSEPNGVGQHGVGQHGVRQHGVAQHGVAQHGVAQHGVAQHGVRQHGGELPPGRDFHRGRTGQFNPTLFLFDALPGGVGLAERIYERAPELVQAAATLIDECPCQSGCPTCVGPEDDQAGAPARATIQRNGSRKALASRLLEIVLRPSPSQPSIGLSRPTVDAELASGNAG